MDKRISIVLSIVFIQLYMCKAQVNFIHLAPIQTSVNGWSNGRAPNGTLNHTTMRAMYLVPASEMTAIATQTSITSFGFNYNNGATGGTPPIGNFSVYLMNTTNGSYTLG